MPETFKAGKLTTARPLAQKKWEKDVHNSNLITNESREQDSTVQLENIFLGIAS